MMLEDDYGIAYFDYISHSHNVLAATITRMECCVDNLGSCEEEEDYGSRGGS